jgi:polyisoprenoid-binding protein YceI
MKKWVLNAWVIWIGTASFAQPYAPVSEGSTVTFKIRNFGFSVSGSFSGMGGIIYFDANNLPACRFDVSLDANSLNTGIDMRDNHLREVDYFDVKKYPSIHFQSTRVGASGPSGHYMVYGKLTIKNQTRDISFPFTATDSANDYRFKGEFKMNRKDFGVGGSSTISDNLELTLNVLAKNTKK